MRKLQIHDMDIASSMTNHAVTYFPGVKFIEPQEVVNVSVITHKTDGQGHHAVYRRDTQFAGSMSEALAVLSWE